MGQRNPAVDGLSRFIVLFAGWWFGTFSIFPQYMWFGTLFNYIKKGDFP